MDQLERLHGDLRFVRGALDDSTQRPSPSALYFLWAAIVLIGFSLVDFRHEAVPAYWSVAAPVGFMVSASLGWRHANRIGQASSSAGRRHMLHWGAVLTAVALAVALGMSRAMPLASIGTEILLLLAVGYFTAGLHLDRGFLRTGVLLGIASVVVTLAPVYAWTFVGSTVALSLVAAGIRAGRPYEATA